MDPYGRPLSIDSPARPTWGWSRSSAGLRKTHDAGRSHQPAMTSGSRRERLKIGAEFLPTAGYMTSRLLLPLLASTDGRSGLTVTRHRLRPAEGTKSQPPEAGRRRSGGATKNADQCSSPAANFANVSLHRPNKMFGGLQANGSDLCEIRVLAGG